MFRKFLISLLTLTAICSLTACGGSAPASTPASDSEAPKMESTAPQETVAEKPSSDPVTVRHSYTYKTVDDADYSTITLSRRENSEYVAIIDGTIYTPKMSETYQASFDRNVALQEEIEALGLPMESIWFNNSYVNLEDGYTSGNFLFTELDGSNFSYAHFIADYIGFPMENGYMNFSQCEQILLDRGYVLDFAID